LNKYTRTENKGGVMGIASSANLLGTLIGYLSCGIVASAFGLEFTFVISGLLLLFVAALLIEKFEIKVSKK
jgi:MFS family permease